MKRLISILSGLLLLATIAQSQNQVDALRYSRLGFGGSSRFNSMAGAFGALGADFSSLSFNPAGIGIYKSQEFSLTTGFFIGKTQTSFNGTSSEDLKYNLNLGNLGMVWSFEAGGAEHSWKYFQFGFGVNRLANFNNRISVQGPNLKTSLMDDYLLKAQGSVISSFDPYDIGLAWQTYLLDTVPGGVDFFSPVPAGGIMQRKDITTWGGLNEMVFSFGGNYSDRLFLGATIGVPYIRYHEESTYSETDAADTIASFKQFLLNESIKTTGNGINLKLGFIYRPVDFMRIGGAIHTPTFYSLKDSYSRNMISHWDDNTQYTASTDPGTMDYELTTPMRAIGSIAFLFQKFGMISVDYEFVDYSEARLRALNSGSASVAFSEANNNIRQNYMASSNLRIGGEIKLSPISLRAGYAIYNSPYKNNLNDGKTDFLTFGLGLREKKYFLDFSYVMSTSKENYYLYPSVGDAAANTLSTTAITATVGMKF
jgi:hypothetical protein